MEINLRDTYTFPKLYVTLISHVNRFRYDYIFSGAVMPIRPNT